MPKKYHIDVHPTPHRLPTIGRSGIVDWGEGCLRCAKCVKQRCIYDVYRKRTFSTDIFSDTVDALCKDCFRCVQGCPKRLIHKTLNPEYEALGDDVYTPEIISATWDQAESGKIPVSGAGYGGPFSGPGFDSMWTDMSEIVRPTRDGIHGREYISTVVDLGRKPFQLAFGPDGALLTKSPPAVRIPIPMVFDVFPFGALSLRVWEAVARAAAKLGTLVIAPESVARDLPRHADLLVPVLDPSRVDATWATQFRMVEIPDSLATLDAMAALKIGKPGLLASVRMPAIIEAQSIERVVQLHKAGVDVIHYVADERGYEPGKDGARHVSEIVRHLHGELIGHGLRDEVTVMVTGGIAMAEHVIKTMLCGANLVGVDVPLLVALECRACRNCRDGGPCPVSMPDIDPVWGAQRMVNLIGAWHNQLLEMMGAMGIREARRLRGEQGRVMFKEDLENDTFAKLFSSSV